MMKINILYEKINFLKKEKNELIIKRVLKTCKRELKLNENLEVSILITNKEFIKNLNWKYRSINKYTNVLSFPQENNFKNISNSELVLGDIVLCLEKIKIDSKLYVKKFENYFAHIFLHGFLHLLGYDHSKKKDKLIMEELEKKILSKMSIPDPYKI